MLAKYLKWKCVLLEMCNNSRDLLYQFEQTKDLGFLHLDDRFAIALFAADIP